MRRQSRAAWLVRSVLAGMVLIPAVSAAVDRRGQALAAIDSSLAAARSRGDSLRCVESLEAAAAEILAGAADEAAYAAVDSLLTRTSHVQAGVFGPHSLPVADTFDALASFRANTSQYEAALTARLQCLAIRESLLPGTDPVLAQTRGDLGVTYGVLARYAEARPYLDAARPVLERNRPRSSVPLVGTLVSLGEMRRIENRFAAAESCLIHALAVTRTDLPDRDDLVGTVRNNLAGLYKDQGRFDEAEPLLRQCLATYTGASPTDPDLVAPPATTHAASVP